MCANRLLRLGYCHRGVEHRLMRLPNVEPLRLEAYEQRNGQRFAFRFFGCANGGDPCGFGWNRLLFRASQFVVRQL